MLMETPNACCKHIDREAQQQDTYSHHSDARTSQARSVLLPALHERLETQPFGAFGHVIRNRTMYGTSMSTPWSSQSHLHAQWGLHIFAKHLTKTEIHGRPITKRKNIC